MNLLLRVHNYAVEKTFFYAVKCNIFAALLFTNQEAELLAQSSKDNLSTVGDNFKKWRVTYDVARTKCFAEQSQQALLPRDRTTNHLWWSPPTTNHLWWTGGTKGGWLPPLVD
jgi:hypothetical protein